MQGRAAGADLPKVGTGGGHRSASVVTVYLMNTLVWASGGLVEVLKATCKTVRNAYASGQAPEANGTLQGPPQL